MDDFSQQQEEILYFVKESIELENKQIQQLIIGHFYIIFVSFSGSIYIFEKGEEFFDQDEHGEFINTTDSSTEENQVIKSKGQRQPEKKKNLFLDFDHKLELPFAKSLILNDNQKEIKLLIVAKNGEMCNLIINIDSFKIINFSLTKMSLDIQKKEEKLIKSAKIIDNSKLLIMYPFQIYLIQNVQGLRNATPASMIFECDAEIDQLDYFENILCISTKKRYYTLNLLTQQAIKLGSAKSIEMQDFYGITFFPRNQNESVMAARPNGNMWKAQANSGKVLTTLQFTDEDNNKLKQMEFLSKIINKNYYFYLKSFGRLYAFNRYILSINGQNRLYIIDMNDKQLMTKIFPNCSQLTFLYNHSNQNDKNKTQERSFYLYYMENGKNLVIERCSIKNIQKSFEASLSKNSVGQCAELFEKYEALQNIKNLKSLLKANLQNQQNLRFQFSSSFKDCVKKIEEEQFQWIREKEIDQNEFKQNIEQLQKCKQQQSTIHHQTEQNIIKIIDIHTQPFKLIDKSIKKITLSDSYLSCQFNQDDQNNNVKCLINTAIGNQKFNKLQNNLQQQVTLKNKQFSQKRQNFKKIKSNLLPLRNQELLAQMVENILPKQQNQQHSAKMNKTVKNVNQLVSQKIQVCQIDIFKQQLLEILRERNPDVKEFIEKKLKNENLIQILMIVSKNFTKQFISIQSNFFSNEQLNNQISYVIQLKSRVDILNSVNIYLQLFKFTLINLLIYYIGESFANQIINQIEENQIEFDQIASVINQLSVN